MRVIAGVCKGRKLFQPRTDAIRPTSDRVKEAIFNIIGERVIQANVLDLFAGTGNLTIEALSRGAKNAVLIDRSVDAIKLIHKNLEHCGFLEKCTILKTDAFRFLKNAVKRHEQFGLIFADPPYLQDLMGSLIKTVDLGDLLKKGGLFILEHQSMRVVSIPLKTLTIFQQKKYGNTAVTFFARKETE